MSVKYICQKCNNVFVETKKVCGDLIIVFRLCWLCMTEEEKKEAQRIVNLLKKKES